MSSRTPTTNSTPLPTTRPTRKRCSASPPTGSSPRSARLQIRSGVKAGAVTHAAGQQNIDAIGAQVAAHVLDVQVQFARSSASTDPARAALKLIWGLFGQVIRPRFLRLDQTRGVRVYGPTEDSGREAYL